ncbi:hypothetical protein ACFFQF_29200 [Haladaptatus pallidirubidus]|nr:hypothetical protein [Haladaptatus pallidirubidus]
MAVAILLLCYLKTWLSELVNQHNYIIPDLYCWLRNTTLMSEPTKPQPSDLLPKYLVEGLQKQDSETLQAIAHYAQELRVYRAARAEAERTAAANTHQIEQATAEELAAKAHAKGIPEDIADWSTIFEKGVPAKASIVRKTINDNEYYYFQWREGDRIRSEYLAPVSPK